MPVHQSVSSSRKTAETSELEREIATLRREVQTLRRVAPAEPGPTGGRSRLSLILACLALLTAIVALFRH